MVTTPKSHCLKCLFLAYTTCSTQVVRGGDIHGVLTQELGLDQQLPSQMLLITVPQRKDISAV